MAEYLIQESTLVGLGNKIRVLTGIEELITPIEMQNNLETHNTEMNQVLSTQDDLIAQIAAALEGKMGASVETSTVTIQGDMFFGAASYTVKALVFENNKILAIEEYFTVGNDSSYILQNVIRNSIVTIKSDGYMSGTGISGTLDFGDGNIRNENYYVIGTFFSTQIIDENAEINVSTTDG